MNIKGIQILSCHTTISLGPGFAFVKFTALFCMSSLTIYMTLYNLYNRQNIKIYPLHMIMQTLDWQFLDGTTPLESPGKCVPKNLFQLKCMYVNVCNKGYTQNQNWLIVSVVYQCSNTLVQTTFHMQVSLGIKVEYLPDNRDQYG